MAITKIIKNRSGETRNILNRQVAHGEDYEISANFWLKLYEDLIIAENVTNGDYIVNDGNSDLTPEKGLKLISRFQPYEGDDWERRRFSIQVHKTKNGNNFMSNATWFDIWPEMMSSGSYSGFGSSTQPVIVPYACKLSKASIIFRKARFDWRSTSGSIYFCLGFYNHLYNGTELLCKLNAELEGEFSGNNTGYGTFKFLITDFEELNGSNSFDSLDVIGIQLRKDNNQDGQIYSVSDPILLLEFEEI